METTTETAGTNKKRKIAAIIIFSLLAIAGGTVIYLYLVYKSTHISTDDAFIEGRVHVIASKVPGTVKLLYIRDNQFVKKGDLLVGIDALDYDVKVREADSSVNAEKGKLAAAAKRLDVLRKQLAELQYAINSAKANLELQEANLKLAQTDIRRAENLIKKEAIPTERFDRTKTGYDVAVAQVKAAGAQLKQAESSLATQDALIREAEASYKAQASVVQQKEATLETAELNRSYTNVYAPSDGYITKRTVETGNQVQVGQPLMAIVPLGDIWVTANFKETQLEKVRPGQGVEITVDTYPGKTFKGRIDSVMAGTGSVFSLFPPENATGNYVKVVQRIPVKIIFDKDTDPGHVLRMGMSVQPTIIIKK